jgi:hypothetical protein
MLTDVVQEYRRSYDLHILPQICWLPPTGPYYPDIFPFNLHMYAKHHFSGTWKNKNDKKETAQASSQGTGALGRIREILCDIRDFHYKLPPSPVWREDFSFRRKNVLRSKP